MIKFFGLIGQNLIMENKTSKYFKYAIGEILLVVIGILIAVQINNWNANRIERQKESLILKELHNEFVSNKKQFDSVVYYHKRAYQSVEFIKSRLPLKLNEISLDTLSYHLYHFGWTYTFNPSKGVTNALMNSSTFNVISNNELRKILISWDDVLTDYQEEELLAQFNYNSQSKLFEQKHFAWTYNYKDWLTDPRVDLAVLNSLEFDNYIYDRHNYLNNIVHNGEGELELISNTIDRIIELSKPDDDD